MITGPKYKICRRLGERVFTKCQTTKFSISGSVNKTSKSIGGRRPRALSDYGRQLLEKQKARYTYGISEHQFANYVSKSRRERANSTVALYASLESRLDNAVYRAGLAPSRAAARQLVSHGHIQVNDRRVNVPSYQIKVNDQLTIRPQSQTKMVFQGLTERARERELPNWLVYDESAGRWLVKAVPTPGSAELNLNFGTIIEFYSRV